MGLFPGVGCSPYDFPLVFFTFDINDFFPLVVHAREVAFEIE